MKSLQAFLYKIGKLKITFAILLGLVVIGVFLRVISLPIIGFHGDFGVFNFWETDLTRYGIFHFYENSSCNYLPIYVYLLKFSHLIQPIITHLNSSWSHDQVVWISYKFPCFIFDLLTAYFIFLFIFRRTKNKILGALGVIFYLFNPVLFHNTYIYGQNNVLLYFPTVLLLYAISEKKFYLSGFALAILMLIKPTGIIIMPFVILLFILQNKKDYKAYLQFFVSFYVILQILILPFYFRLPWDFGKLFYSSLTTGNGYKVTEMYSYNLWYLFTGSSPVSDAIKFWGRSYYFWGMLMLAISYVATALLLYLYKAKNYLILLTIVYFSFFIFPTRVHEGYLLFAFPAFILAIFIYRNYILAIIYLISSASYAYNIWGYWPWKLINYLPVHYGGRLASLSAYIIILTPFVLGGYFVFINQKNKRVAK